MLPPDGTFGVIYFYTTSGIPTGKVTLVKDIWDRPGL